MSKSLDVVIAINLRAMHDLAWDEVFKEKVHPYLRAVFDMWLYCSLQGAPSSSELIGLVAAAIDRDEQTAKKWVRRAIDVAHLEVSKDKKDNRKKLLSMTPMTFEKYQQVLKLHRDILKVIAAQIANPEDPTAGYEFVPASIYTNVEHE